MLRNRKVPKSYDQTPFEKADKSLKKDIIVQAFLQGYTLEDLFGYKYSQSNSLQNTLLTETSNFVFSYGECLRHFSNDYPYGRDFYAQNLATEFYDNPKYKSFTMADASQNIRDIVFHFTAMPEFAPKQFESPASSPVSLQSDAPDEDEDFFGLNFDEPIQDTPSTDKADEGFFSLEDD